MLIKLRTKTRVNRALNITLAAVLIFVQLVSGISNVRTVQAWSSGGAIFNTHSRMTHSAIDAINVSNSRKYEDLLKYQSSLENGSGNELTHEIGHGGTNWGGDVLHWWDWALKEYKKGNLQNAYYNIGSALHIIQDMTVPSHAYHILHGDVVENVDSPSQSHTDDVELADVQHRWTNNTVILQDFGYS